jgi:DNA invertase Pin-like site-specific DNA recombinase
MTGQLVGYRRVSTLDQNAARQLEGLLLDECFEDKASGKDAIRPQLEALLKHVRKGDIVVCHSMDRMARNLDDLRRLVSSLTACGVQVRFVKESLTFTGEESPMANLLLSIMGAFAEFERQLIKERQREGIAVAKQRGVYRGRKRSLSDQAIADLCKRAAQGEPKAGLAREYNISRQTLYAYCKIETGSPASCSTIRQQIQVRI